MKRKVRLYSSAFIISSILVLAGLVVLHSFTRKGIEVTYTEDKKIGVKVNDIHYSRTREGRVEWVLDARSATSFKVAEEMVFDSVKLVFYAKDGRSYVMDAEKGRFDESTGVVSVSGDVRVRSLDGLYRLTTDTLSYSSETGLMTTPDRVRIFSGSMDVTGTGLRVDIEGGRLFLEKDVTAHLFDSSV